MFEIIRKIWKTGVVSRKLPFEPAPARYRGKLQLQAANCNCCKVCAEACPTGAITVSDATTGCYWSVSYGKCVFCGRCAEVCPNLSITMTQDYHLSTKNKAELVQVAEVTRQ